MVGNVTTKYVSISSSAYRLILKVKFDDSVIRRFLNPSKSVLNFCRPKLVYFLYVVLKNVFEGFPFKYTF